MIKETADEGTIGSLISARVLASSVTISPASAGAVGSKSMGDVCTPSTPPLEVSSAC